MWSKCWMEEWRKEGPVKVELCTEGLAEKDDERIEAMLGLQLLRLSKAGHR